MAASVDPVGAPQLGGTWNLQFTTGPMDTAAPLTAAEQAQWQHLLGTIAVDNTSSAVTAAGGASTLTFSHTVNTGSNSILIVNVTVAHGGAPDPVTSVTYGGQSLTLVGSANVPNSESADIWYLLNPTVGTANVVINLTGSCHFEAGATDYFGVDQTTPLGTLATASGGILSSPSVNVASAAGEVVVDSIVTQGLALALTPSGPGQTELWTQATGASAGDALGAGSYAPGAASVTMSWTEIALANWASPLCHCCPLQPVPAAPASVSRAAAS